VTADSSKPNSFILCEKKQGVRRRAGNYGAISPCSFKRGTTGAEVIFSYSIMGNFMVYQDRIETNLLQLFTQQENSEWFSSFMLLFLRSILLLTRNKRIGNDLLVFL